METASGRRDEREIYPELPEEQRRVVEKKILLESTLPMLEDRITFLEKTIEMLSLQKFAKDMLNKDVAHLRINVLWVRERVNKL